MENIIIGHTNSVMSVAVSSDQKHILSGSVDQTVKQWNFETGDLEKTIECHSSIKYVAYYYDNDEDFSGYMKNARKVI